MNAVQNSTIALTSRCARIPKVASLVLVIQNMSKEDIEEVVGKELAVERMVKVALLVHVIKIT